MSKKLAICQSRSQVTKIKTASSQNLSPSPRTRSSNMFKLQFKNHRKWWNCRINTRRKPKVWNSNCRFAKSRSKITLKKISKWASKQWDCRTCTKKKCVCLNKNAKNSLIGVIKAWQGYRIYQWNFPTQRRLQNAHRHVHRPTSRDLCLSHAKNAKSW